jgi:TPR repeat protein
VWSFRRGRRAEQRGDDEAAERHFREAADRGDAHAAFHVGLARERRGDETGAREWFERAAAGGDGEAAARLRAGVGRDRHATAQLGVRARRADRLDDAE